MLATALAIMLTKADIGGLQGGKFSESQKTAIAAMVITRASVLATAQYATYPASSDSVVIHFTFPANSLQAGNQVRFQVYGKVTNTSGATRSFSPSVLVTQGSAVQAISVLYQAPAVGGQFVIDGGVSFNYPGPPPVANSFTTSQTTNNLVSNRSLTVGSMVRLNNRIAATTVDSDIGVVTDPNTLTVDNTKPVDIALSINTGALLTFSIIGGTIESM